jgi:hypothetical protein
VDTGLWVDMNASDYKLMRRELGLWVCLAVCAIIATLASCSRKEVAREVRPVDLTLLSLEELMHVRVTNVTAKVHY